MLNEDDSNVQVEEWVIVIRVLTTKEHNHEISHYITINNVKQFVITELIKWIVHPKILILSPHNDYLNFGNIDF